MSEANYRRPTPKPLRQEKVSVLKQALVDELLKSSTLSLQVERRDSTIAKQQTKIEQGEQRVRELEQLLAAAAQQIESSDEKNTKTQLKQCETEISKLKATQQKYFDALGEKDVIIQQQAKQISHFDEAAQQFQRTYNQLKERNVALAAKIIELSKRKREQVIVVDDVVNEIFEAPREFDQRQKALETQQLQRDEAVARLEQQIAELKARNGELTEIVSEYKDKFAAQPELQIPPVEDDEAQSEPEVVLLDTEDEGMETEPADKPRTETTRDMVAEKSDFRLRLQEDSTGQEDSPLSDDDTDDIMEIPDPHLHYDEAPASNFGLLAKSLPKADVEHLSLLVVHLQLTPTPTMTKGSPIPLERMHNGIVILPDNNHGNPSLTTHDPVARYHLPRILCTAAGVKLIPGERFSSVAAVESFAFWHFTAKRNIPLSVVKGPTVRNSKATSAFTLGCAYCHTELAITRKIVK
ncbi:hypothetical protein BABINDRAFT_81082 [Babjeviella inositovora NRRL Y-12698]|uniref:Uncharacterized protein n=1 Tax=Babjeviella inositovora NRRL Y-12698 TaxID=984486 RepID=A0A1E3QZK9_9ASCO|nr:uncharacterized protein BABINDRAFT_81082 [Babjeviella inositovora NRRL Y-12698]ODQ83113.1 hypothetical protein BABINDRAFT_81082 [Babjeviella inositovora NRRL Y-12698]